MRSLQETARDQSLIVLLFILLISLLSGKLAAQSLSLVEAYELLEANYPVLENAALNDELLQLELDLLALEKKPQLFLKGSATLQSETTSFGSDAEALPVNIDIPLYSVRGYGEVNYNLHDGGRLDAREKVIAAEGKIANQQLEVDRFGLRTSINQLFLSVLLLRDRVALFEPTLSDLRARKSALEEAVALGAALESELLQLRVREVEILAELDNLQGQIERSVAHLSTLTGRTFSPNVELLLPELPTPKEVPELSRPEFELFALQRQAVLANADFIEADTKPVISAFVQAGIGAPNPLNLFDNNIAPYAIGGVNFQWKFKDWGRSDLRKQRLEVQTSKLQRQEATLRFNLDAGVAAYLADVDRLQGQVIRDQEIAGLQATVLEQMAAQLDNGVITANDYLAQANAELRARQQLKIHQTELLQLQLTFLNDRGLVPHQRK
jgi:outer membrane protein TolC